ncbi:hypothetical protein AMATHDRAFT_147437, partial [Amanita thiersii Skay4041]
GPDAACSCTEVYITATITNTGTEDICLLCDPRTMCFELPTEKCAVTKLDSLGGVGGHQGRQPQFRGYRAKYVPSFKSAMDHCIPLAPGESRSTKHNLSKMYDLCHSGKGTYQVSPFGSGLPLAASLQPKRLRVGTREVSASVDGNINVGDNYKTQFIGCDAGQQADIELAAAAAQTYTINANFYFSTLQPNLANPTRRYKTWFGTYPTQDQINTVSSHFAELDTNDFTSFTYDCTSCTSPDSFAYVQVDQFGVINLCPAFWDAPLMGTDSKAGTIVHEASHFVVNGNTQDFAYGQREAKQLAKDDPDSAVMNADSHEYFVENDPTML